MLLVIPDVLDADALRTLRARIDTAEWVDGNATSGHQVALAKNNLQLPETSVEGREGAQLILESLFRNPLFIAAALPRQIIPPLFNRYGEGHALGTHIDNAVRIQKSTGLRVRSDLSMTVFLSEPEDYDGGELTIETQFGVQQVKLRAGQAVLYPASSLHRVEPITRGERLASFLWIESMVRDDSARQIMFDLDSSIQQLAEKLGQGDPQIIRLTGVYHNLLRRWAET